MLRYRIHLEQRHYAPATINLRLAAVRRVAYEAADAGLLSPELAAGIRRVKGVRRLGVRLGNWLTPEQGRRLLDGSRTPSHRRASCATTRCSPCSSAVDSGAANCWPCNSRGSSNARSTGSSPIWSGKGGHVRTVPMPTWVKDAIDAWTAAAGITEGTVFRAINKAGRVWGDGMTAKVLWDVVRAAAATAGIDKLAPHDLRRTCARLCHLAGGELDQIQFLLGHVSIQTTERYLGCKQKLRCAVNDRLGIEPDADLTRQSAGRMLGPPCATLEELTRVRPLISSRRNGCRSPRKPWNSIALVFRFDEYELTTR